MQINALTGCVIYLLIYKLNKELKQTKMQEIKT